MRNAAAIFVLMLVGCSSTQLPTMQRAAEITEQAASIVSATAPLVGQAPIGAVIAALLTGISGILYQRSVGKSKEKSYNKGLTIGASRDNK